MGKARMETFSDSVIAIVLTIMVLEIKVPLNTELGALRHLGPIFLSYVLSFVFLGIYWNNHHHLLQATKNVDGKVLWANLHLLFWLTLIPFVTAYMGENHLHSLPVALYGVVMLGSAIAYYILTRSLVHLHGKSSIISKAIGEDLKGKISLALYTISIPLAFEVPIASLVIYVCVALLWLVPDSRIERVIKTR